MRLDRKFFLIAPTLVLVLIVAGMFYTATRLRLIVEGSDNWQHRSDYIAAVEQGKRPMTHEKALQIVRLSLEAERLRTGAIIATNELLLTLGALTLGCCAMLLWAIRGVPRTVPIRGRILFGGKNVVVPSQGAASA
ncbi:MAG TPA: hypothetical protein VGJ18_09365 [Gemmatimonadaceae bacterium]|jgi:hypothetical protein